MRTWIYHMIFTTWVAVVVQNGLADQRNDSHEPKKWLIKNARLHPYRKTIKLFCPNCFPLPDTFFSSFSVFIRRWAFFKNVDYIVLHSLSCSSHCFPLHFICSSFLSSHLRLSRLVSSYYFPPLSYCRSGELEWEREGGGGTVFIISCSDTSHSSFFAKHFPLFSPSPIFHSLSVVWVIMMWNKRAVYM